SNDQLARSKRPGGAIPRASSVRSDAPANAAIRSPKSSEMLHGRHAAMSQVQVAAPAQGEGRCVIPQPPPRRERSTPRLSDLIAEYNRLKVQHQDAPMSGYRAPKWVFIENHLARHKLSICA